MKILALELSTARGGLAFLSEAADLETGAIASEKAIARSWPNDRKNAGAFFENLADVNNHFGSPDRIVVGLGPGSYAGTRIAISAAIGLHFASGAELVGLPSICAMGCDAVEYCVIGDARRQSFFFARIRANELIEGPDLLSEAELRPKIDELHNNLSIFASEQLPSFRRVQLCYPSARVLARLAREANRRFVLPPLEPIYLREAHITIPRSK
jgi:tRNA threonylcarbamoyladenosine biosynthesis protein TsaB